MSETTLDRAAAVPRTATEPLMDVQDLVMRFPISGSREVVHAVNGVSFTIGAGETLGLVGESGSGKTTVGRLLLGLLKASSGSVVFKGHELTTLNPKRMRALRPRIQMVFQDPYEALNPRLRVEENIRIPLRNGTDLSGQAEADRIIELAELVGLERRLLRAYPHELSGGQQQRVGIARAMATEPDLIVLDEPVSNLDPTVRADIIDLLVSVQQRTGVSYVFISHDLTTVEFLSHRVAIMYLGEIVEMGPTAELFERQYHPYSRALLSSVLYPDPNDVRPRFPLSGEIPSPIHLPSGCFLASRCPLVSQRCIDEHPPLVVRASSRLSACHYAELVDGFDPVTRTVNLRPRPVPTDPVPSSEPATTREEPHP